MSTTKRKCTDQEESFEDAHNGEDPVAVTKDDLEQFRKDMLAHMSDLHQKSLDSTMQLFSKCDVKNEKRFNAIEKDVASLHKDQESLRRSQEESWAAIRDLQKALAVAEAAVPLKDKLDFGDFNRRVDCTILRIKTDEIVPKTEIERVLRPWLEEAECDARLAEIVGPDSNRHFTIQFKGNAGIANANLKKARSLLRDEHGWRTFTPCTAPGGSTTTSLYIDIDKNPRQKKCEADGKRLRDAFQQLYPRERCKDKPIFWNRVDGLFTIKGELLARIVPENDDQPSHVEWHLAIVAKHGIDRDAVRNNYHSRARLTPAAAASSIAWSRG